MEQEEDGKQITLWAYKLEFAHPITKEKKAYIDLPPNEGSWKIIEEIRNEIM